MRNYTDKLALTFAKGELKKNRTGIPCLAITPQFFEHDMNQGFPLLTKKYVSIKNVAIELQAFIGGITDKRWLQARGCNIWNSWANPATTTGKPEDNYDLGEYYGWCWRRFGQPYTERVVEKLEPHFDQPYDQLARAIHTLKTNPDDRRMVISAWNPLGLNRTALPSCHLMFILQHINGKLSLNWTQRSVDAPIGLPYNIASYGLLLTLIAKEVGMQPHMLTGNLVDFHIYENQIEGVREMLSRGYRRLPDIDIKNWSDIWNWDYQDVSLYGYNPHPAIPMPVAV